MDTYTYYSDDIFEITWNDKSMIWNIEQSMCEIHFPYDMIVDDKTIYHL